MWEDSLNRGPVVAFRRDEVLVLVNTGPEPVRLPAGEVLLSSTDVTTDLPGDAAVWMRAVQGSTAAAH